MLLRDFRNKAEECFRIAERSCSRRDRELFKQMALAWLGRDEAEEGTVQPTERLH